MFKNGIILFDGIACLRYVFRSCSLKYYLSWRLISLKNKLFPAKNWPQNFGMPFMPPIFFIIFIMPLPFIFFIMPCICSNSLSKRLTS